MCGGRRYMGNLCTPARFLCESKTALKKTSLNKNKNKTTVSRGQQKEQMTEFDL